jgi:hypothetical protein
MLQDVGARHEAGHGVWEAEMGGIERQQLYGAVILLVTALFVASGYAPASRWRRPLRGAAIGLFILAVAAATAEIILWLAEPGR